MGWDHANRRDDEFAKPNGLPNLPYVSQDQVNPTPAFQPEFTHRNRPRFSTGIRIFAIRAAKHGLFPDFVNGCGVFRLVREC